METSDRKQGGRDYQAAGVWGVVRARGGRLYIPQSVCVWGGAGTEGSLPRKTT